VLREKGPLPEKVALGYYRDLLTAFRSLTRLNIMHRDLKPGNILFHSQVLKLADFGFCKSLQSPKDLTHTMLGSPIYMAPEVLKGEIYTIKADIWSLGVVLYEMLFGFCPFEESSIARLISLL
jgi:serine/threonine protein kinase